MIIKKLEKEDFQNYTGYYKTLSNLSHSSELSPENSVKILEEINNAKGEIFIAIENNEIICSITVLIEKKFIRGGSKCAHIEDVVTRKEYEGKGIGSQVLNKAVEFAVAEGCYKIILDCEEELMNFYQKSGFKNTGVFASRRFI